MVLAAAKTQQNVRFIIMLNPGGRSHDVLHPTVDSTQVTIQILSRFNSNRAVSSLSMKRAQNGATTQAESETCDVLHSAVDSTQHRTLGLDLA